MTDIKANPLFDQFGPYESETLARQIGKQIAERGHDVAVWNVSGEFWFVSNKPDEVSPFHSGENRYPGFVIPAKDKPKRNPHGKATTLKAIVKYLNGLSRKEIKEFAKQDSVPMNRRLSLMVFIRDWRVDDPTHEEYLRGVAEGHSTDEALQAGDLLNFLMVGGKELQLYKGDDFVPTTRWTEYLGPFLEKVPATRGVEDLIGVHDAVLGMLPMKTYNHYTIAEVFADHPDLKTAMLGEPVLLSPIEFKALASLQNIVDSGSIGQFKLALSKGSNKGIAKLAEARGGDIGGIVLSAFKLAQAAVAAFKTGDYRTAKELMDDLQRQYGIGAGSFASVEEYMFIATLSAPRAFTENPNTGRFGFKGNPRQVLLALDTTFNTDANDHATPARRAMAARIVAQQNAWKYNGTKVESGESYNTYGTNGYRNFVVNHKKGGSGSGRKDTETRSIMSTDWLAIFYAIANAEKIVSSTLKPLTMTTINDVFSEVFSNPTFGIEGFEAGTSSSKAKINTGKIIKYFQDTLKKGDNWKDYLIGNKNARAKDRKWDYDKLMKDYPKETHPDIYSGGKSGSDITPYQGNEPMYRFLVYSDLQNPNQSLLGNFNPKGTLTVILRAAQDGQGEKGWLPFEADMFYESYYNEDYLDKLLPSVSQDGKPDEEINLNDLSLSGRARRRARSEPSDAIVPIYAGEPKGVKENLGAIFSEIVIGRNVVKDVGEVVQSIYRGLVGGRTSMAEKRMAMAVASMQKELSDRAIEAGGNAVANLKMDYEMIDGSATLTVMAHADAIVLPANKVKKNPHKQDGPYAWWEPDPRGHQIYNKSSSLQFINNQLVGDQNISRRDVFNTVAAGIERKYGVRYEVITEQDALSKEYLYSPTKAQEERRMYPRTPDLWIYEEDGKKKGFFDGRNYGTWDEENGVVYFNEEMFNDRKTALRELGHETGAVIIASMYGGKDNIPRADYHGMNSVKGLTHLVDSYTFGWYEPKPGQSKAIVRSNPPAERQARKKSSSKKPSSGNMISIELTPRTQVQLSTAVDKADWFKAAMKEDKSGKLKELWNEYAKGDNPGIITERGIVRGWKWRGKNYMFSKDELKGGKSTNKQRRKKFPASLEKAIAKDGTYADYKKGQTNMRMIYAKRIDNGRLVPFRINIPKILLRKRADKVVPKAGGKKSHVQMLLDLIEENFGTITLDKQFVSSGGYDTYKETERGRKLDVPVDRGIHLLYKAQGLDTEGAYSTNAFPAYTRGGKIVYRAMSFDGKPVDMEVAG